MATEEPRKAISLRLSRDEQRMVKEMATDLGVSSSDVLRMALREMWARRGGTKAPKPKR